MVKGEGPGWQSPDFFLVSTMLLLGPIPNEWKRLFKLGCGNEGEMQSSIGSEEDNKYYADSIWPHC